MSGLILAASSEPHAEGHRPVASLDACGGESAIGAARRRLVDDARRPHLRRLWAFAPLGVADVPATVVVASAMLITMGFGGWTSRLPVKTNDRLIK